MRTVLLFVYKVIFFGLPLSAQHYYYTPNTTQIPTLAEKNDAGAGVGISWGSDYTALEFQGVYSPVQHGAVMLNGFFSGSGAVRDDEEVGTNFRFLELGVGAYTEMERAYASIFVGAGQGDLYNNYGADNFSRFTVRRYFLQPGLMYKDRYFRCGLALRLSRIAYPKGESSFDIDPTELESIRKIEEDAPFFMPELGLSSAILLPPCVVSINLTSVFPDAAGLNFNRFNMNLMLTFEIGKMEKKKDKGKKKK